jgi:glucokinase
MSNNKQHTLGIDIGGTNIDMGLMANGVLVQKTSFAVDAFTDRQELLTQLIDSIGSFELNEVRGIGIGVPGIINPESGFIFDLQNLPMWYKLPLGEILSKEFSLPVKLNNDASCFALGHAHYGLGKQSKNFVGLTLGTGLGMGIIINRSLYSGVFAGAGEIGMLPYNNGIVEEFAASTYFIRHFGQSAKDLHLQAQQGMDMALEAFNDYGVHLGNAIKIVMSMLAPELIILGGSIAHAFPYFRDSMQSTINGFEYTEQLEQTKILNSGSSEMGIMGAAALIAP